MKYFDSVGSTNSEAKNFFIQGETEGLIVVAKKQTAGCGRKGRSWLSPVGGLYFSIILNPRLSTEAAPLLGLLSGCAVFQSLLSLGVKNVSLKWPNDVMVGEKKIAGILCEVVTMEDESTGIIVGIGVNQNCPIVRMPAGLQWPTTSVVDEIGKETSLESLLCSITNEIDRLLQTVEAKSSFAGVLNEWRKLSSTIGAWVRIHEEGKIIVGLAKDIDTDGALLVETDEGLRTVIEGDVSYLRTLE